MCTAQHSTADLFGVWIEIIASENGQSAGRARGFKRRMAEAEERLAAGVRSRLGREGRPERLWLRGSEVLQISDWSGLVGLAGVVEERVEVRSGGYLAYVGREIKTSRLAVVEIGVYLVQWSCACYYSLGVPMPSQRMTR